MQSFLKKISLLVAISFSCSSLADELNYNIYQLTSSVQEQVKNDTMKVTFNASHQAPDSSSVNQVVNKQMAQALKLLKATTDIDYQTGNYQTYPTYQQQKISGWRASQQLIVSSKDIAKLTKLVGQLQQYLKISSMGFDVSESQRQQFGQKLSIKALEQFKQRASLIQSTMGADSYQIVNVAVNTGGNYMPMANAMARPQMMMEKSMAAPEVAGGNSTVSVSVSGKIQLVFN